jgi:hypothetical protein
MFRRLLISSALGIVLGVGTICSAEVIVRVAPPAAIVERPIARPGAGYVWIGGYHRWDGRAHVWVPGRWELPPRARARWVSPRWVRRGGGWAFVEGRWR